VLLPFKFDYFIIKYSKSLYFTTLFFLLDISIKTSFIIGKGGYPITTILQKKTLI
jgi:hypothetical protein